MFAIRAIRAEVNSKQTSPFRLALAMPGSGVAIHSILLDTVARLIASVPEETLFTTILA